jgi:hypothetical protein
MAAIQPISGISLPQVNTNTVRYAIIPDYPAYAVGDDGSVWSLWKSQTAGRGKPLPRIIGTTWKRLNPSNDKLGRKVVNLTDGITKKQFKVHRLVMLAFVGICPIDKMVCHNNGINSDNRLENLRYDTSFANQADRLRHGTHNRGERCGTSKLTKQQVVEIAARHKAGESSDSLASEFGICKQHVARLSRKGRWPEVFGSDIDHAAEGETPGVSLQLNVAQ